MLCFRLHQSMAGLASWLVITLAVTVSADEVVLSPSKDTTIYFESENSNSGGSHLFSGATASRNGGASRRLLLGFDVAGSVPANATITEASLSLTVNRVPGNAITNSFGLHTLTQDWIEGSTDATGQEGLGGATVGNDTTWTLTGVTNWNTPGGDFIVEASGSTEVAGRGTYNWSSPGIVSDIQSWLNNGDNFGWILIGDEDTPRTAKRFASRTNDDETSRPTLTIQFELAGLLQGDFTGDGELLVDDIGHLCAAIGDGLNATEFDLNSDQIVDLEDLRVWVEDIKSTFFGDNDLNGRVEFADFLELSGSFGTLQIPQPRPPAFTGWSGGDYNCDDQVGFDDFLKLSANFGKSNRVENASVPEPNACLLSLLTGLALLPTRRRRLANHALIKP